ncbi:MAG: hypothetical protein SPL54_06780, partial [Lachnospiraceae bacterium]|nr:hypothetical protein [Lachnospiraceae bacterium]
KKSSQQHLIPVGLHIRVKSRIHAALRTFSIRHNSDSIAYDKGIPDTFFCRIAPIIPHHFSKSKRGLYHY